MKNIKFLFLLVATLFATAFTACQQEWEPGQPDSELSVYFPVDVNVANFATSRKFRTDFEKINAKIKSFGYNLYWKVLNARDYGSVQNRRRVIWVCVRADVDAGFAFPEPYGITRDLQTILEDCSDVFADTDAKVVIDSSISPYIRTTIEKHIDEIISAKKEVCIPWEAFTYER